jgi:hypothetical protein
MRIRRRSGSRSAWAASSNAVTMELLGMGEHADPSQGGSLLELASVLAGERWSIRPQSVHPALAVVAGTVNDLLADDRRRLLTPLAPWLLSTDTAGAGAWPAVITVCDRAVSDSVSRPEQPRLPPEDLDIARKDPAQASPPSSRGRHGPWAGRWDRRRVRHAIRSAQLSWARSANQCAADALCQLLLDCINACRRLAGEQPVDPRLPLTECPQCLVVDPRFIWPPGCDWMEIAYQPVAGLMPACLRRGSAGAGEEFRDTTA